MIRIVDQNVELGKLFGDLFERVAIAFGSETVAFEKV